MSRWIDADRLARKLNDAIWVGEKVDMPTGELEAVLNDVLPAPSIDIVRCKECKRVRYCETEELDLYLDCDKPDGGGIPRNEEWYCADGEREGE